MARKKGRNLETFVERYALPGIVVVILYRAFHMRLPSVEDLFITPEEQVRDALGDLNFQESEVGRMPFVLTRSVTPDRKKLEGSISFDSGLGEAGLRYDQPIKGTPTPTRYGTYDDDERTTSGSPQAPAREFTIWDSVAKPKKLPAPPRGKKRRFSGRQPAIDITSYVPTRSNSSVTSASNPSASLAPFNQSETGTDYTMLLVVGGLLAAFAASR